MTDEQTKRILDADIVSEKLDEYLFLREALLIEPFPFWY
jgi:hypothetical protein